jgi:phosphohistidine swiveling domain-containing protein
VRFVRRGEETFAVEAAGGKGTALASLAKAGLPVPAWAVLTPDAFYASLAPGQLEMLEAADSGEELQTLLSQLEPSPEVRGELAAILAELCPNGETVAVRSSAVDEDGISHSFAGQLESFLFVPADRVADAVADVWRSGFSERVLGYRFAVDSRQSPVGSGDRDPVTGERDLQVLPPAPAVLIQQMVDADVAGVAFGADPVSGRRGVAVVSAVCGLGTSLVSGEGDADTFRVDRDGRIVERHIALKRLSHRRGPGREGVVAQEVPGELADRPALSDEQVLAVAELARQAGRSFGRPQDIEWAFHRGNLYLLQSRPISSLAALADPDGVFTLWDNSNIAESYNGVTTPLTFSFARRAYAEVYRQLCRILGVSDAAIAEQHATFERMLGLVQGRVYYNLLSWYRLLSLLPGFSANSRFMEQMMGVRDGLPEETLEEIRRTARAHAGGGRLRLGGTLAGLVRSYARLPRQVEEFHRRLDETLGRGHAKIEGRRLDELAADFRELERRLLKCWDTPLVNDLFTMIFTGVLRRLLERWCPDASGALLNGLLRGEEGMVSVEPALRVRELAALAARRPALVDALCGGTLDQIHAAMAQEPDFRAGYEAYLERFGDRCIAELKLESPTLRDDPLMLLRLVGQVAKAGSTPHPDPLPVRGEGVETWGLPLTPGGVGVETAVLTMLGPNPMRRAILRWVLKQARTCGRNRENMRFERTRVFGRVRRIFVEMGRQLAANNVLDDPRDVFYLGLEEVLGYIEGTAISTDLKALASARKAEFARYREMDPPGDRFTSRGAVYQGNSFASASIAASAADGEDRRTGLGCYPGVVRGPARVVVDPRNTELRRGEILVAERTDPGWVLLFPLAAGLLVERGSLLSHSAIVARELGLPTVVSVEGVTRWLKDGDWVELDGANGTVTRLEVAP